MANYCYTFVMPSRSNSDDSLFSAGSTHTEPLAARMRPRTLDDYVGQEHILAPGKLLRRAIQADRISSLIFYGPPGTGKTTLARVIANSTESAFISINAVLAGVKEIRESIAEAKQKKELFDKRTILFVDEVHRWNKSQQDALLPWVENGTIVLIGATTENPYFEVNSALVSRSRIFQLQSLSDENLYQIAQNCLADKSRGYGNYKVTIDDEALDHLVHTAGGDARSILGSLELAVETSVDNFPPPAGTEIHIDLQTAEDSIQQKAVLYDKEGDYHYDIISAFIKAVRGSDPDAGLYWLGKMVHAGESPRFIFRRMLISACEDVGLADPNAINVVESCAKAFDRVGMPEGQYMLTQACLYLCTCPKSNSSLGYFDALNTAATENDSGVPNHLKDDSRDKHAFAHGAGYKYPHAYSNHWVAQDYLPGSLKGRVFYHPSTQGYEGLIQQEVLFKRALQLEQQAPEHAEIFSYTKKNADRDAWIRRTSGTFNSFQNQLLNYIIEQTNVTRHDSVFIYDNENGYLFYQFYAKTPEGNTVLASRNPALLQRVSDMCKELPGIDQPEFREGSVEKCLDTDGRYDLLVLRNALFKGDAMQTLQTAAAAIQPKGSVVAIDPLPAEGTRLSSFLKTENLKVLLRTAEDKVYSRYQTAEALTPAFTEAGFLIKAQKKLNWNNERRIGREDIENWLAPESPLAKALADDSKLKAINTELSKSIAETRQFWESSFVCFTVVEA